MNKTLQCCLKSFCFRKALKTFVIDSLALLIIVVLFLKFGSLLNEKAVEISGGKSFEELKLELLSGSAERNQQFVSSLRSFTFLLISGSIVLLLISFFLVSYSQQLVWNEIFSKPVSLKPEWKWNGITLILVLISLLYVFGYGLLRFILNSFLSFKKEISAQIFNQGVNAAVFLLLIFFIFLTYHSFARSKRVWQSAGEAFSVLKVKWKMLGAAYLLSLAVWIVVSAIYYYAQKSLLQKLLYLQPQWITSIISMGILLLFLSWVRLYVADVVK